MTILTNVFLMTILTSDKSAAINNCMYIDTLDQSLDAIEMIHFLLNTVTINTQTTSMAMKYAAAYGYNDIDEYVKEKRDYEILTGIRM